MNKVELRGIVGNIRVQEYDGSRMARISLATNFAYKEKDGTPVIETSWHNIVAWEGRKVELDGITKGTKLRMIGRIRYQKYTDKDCVERVSTDIIASEVSVIGEENKMQYEMEVQP